MTGVAQPGSTLDDLNLGSNTPRVERPPLITPIGRASFAFVLRPQKPKKPDEKTKYGLSILFKKGEDLTDLKNEVRRVALEKFPDPTTRPKLNLPFRDQGEMKYPGYEPGAIFIRASNEKKPELIDAKKKPITEDKDFYSGCYVRAHIHAFYYFHSGRHGISFGLDSVQKARDGEPLGGRPRAEAVFDAIDDTDSGTEATGLTAAELFG